MSESSTCAPPKSKGAKAKKQNIQVILDSTDWDQYWKDVSNRVERDVHGYAVARAKSLEAASRRVVL